MSSSLSPPAPSSSPLISSPLLSLPPDAAMLVLQGLTLKNARRFVLTTSSATRHAYEEGLTLAHGSKLWSDPALRRLRRFVPAVAFYEGPCERASSWSTLYPEGYKLCKKRVKTMLKRAGLEGTDWDWEYTDRALFDVKAITPPGWAAEREWGYARLSALLQATKCDVCKKHGVRYQCAPCGKLLCAYCAIWCDGDVERRGSKCPFAMCPADYNAVDPEGDHDETDDDSEEDGGAKNKRKHKHKRKRKPKPKPALYVDPDGYGGDDRVGACPQHERAAQRARDAGGRWWVDDDEWGEDEEEERFKRLVGGEVVRVQCSQDSDDLDEGRY